MGHARPAGQIAEAERGRTPFGDRLDGGRQQHPAQVAVVVGLPARVHAVESTANLYVDKLLGRSCELVSVEDLERGGPDADPALDLRPVRPTAPAVVMASRFRLRRLRDVPRFFLDAMRIHRQVRAADGALGVSLVAHPLRREFFT